MNELLPAEEIGSPSALELRYDPMSRDELIAECERLRRDAERYRWLHSHIAPSIIARIDKHANGWPPENLDALIDARLQDTRS